jgi:hypothetical protein
MPFVEWRYIMGGSRHEEHSRPFGRPRNCYVLAFHARARLYLIVECGATRTEPSLSAESAERPTKTPQLGRRPLSPISPCTVRIRDASDSSPMSSGVGLLWWGVGGF